MQHEATDLVEQLKERVDDYQREVEVAESAVQEANAKLECARWHLQRYQGALEAERARLGIEPGDDEGPLGRTASEETRDLRGKTTADAALQVLKDAGNPMHVKDITTEMQRRGWETNAEDPKAAVSAALHREEDKTDARVRRVRAATYDASDSTDRDLRV